MRIYRDEAVVLRRHKLGSRPHHDAHREHGLVRAVAKGCGGPVQVRGVWNRSRIVDLHLYPGRNLDTITQAHTLHAFCDVIAADYGRYTTNCAIVETAERLAGERAPAAGSPADGGSADGAGRGPAAARTDPRRISAAGDVVRRLDAIAQ